MRWGIIIEPTLLNREFGVFKALCQASLSEEDRGKKQSTHLSFDRASIISPTVTRVLNPTDFCWIFFIKKKYIKFMKTQVNPQKKPNTNYGRYGFTHTL